MQFPEHRMNILQMTEESGIRFNFIGRIDPLRE